MKKATVVTTYEVRCKSGGSPMGATSWSGARWVAERLNETITDCGPHHAYRVKTTTTVEATRLPAKKAKP